MKLLLSEVLEQVDKAKTKEEKIKIGFKPNYCFKMHIQKALQV